MNKQSKSTTDNIFTQAEDNFKENDLLDVMVKRGLIPDMSISDDKVKKAQQGKAKREYRNTMELLKNYRRIVYAISAIPEQIAYELGTPLKTVNELVEKCDIDTSYGDHSLDTQLRNAKRSTNLINIVNRALTSVREMPESGTVYYDILYYSYLSDEKYSVDDICEKLGFSQPTYFRKKKEAINLLSTILWFAPNRDLDMWLDVLAILNDEKSKDW